MYKMAIIGDRGSVLGYMALGFSVREAANAAEAGKILAEVAADPSYAVIFITEDYAAALAEEIGRFADKPLPAIVPIPGQNGGNGFGMNHMRTAVERAVGADILFK